LKAEQFGQDRSGRPIAPPLGTLNYMLIDLGSQLGHKVVHPDEGEDE